MIGSESSSSPIPTQGLRSSPNSIGVNYVTTCHVVQTPHPFFPQAPPFNRFHVFPRSYFPLSDRSQFPSLVSLDILAFQYFRGDLSFSSGLATWLGIFNPPPANFSFAGSPLLPFRRINLGSRDGFFVFFCHANSPLSCGPFGIRVS